MPENTKLQQPLVSVIIPTYDRPAYLKAAIASAVRQTYKNIEIIVSDNCSPENPQPIVESFQDERIRFWRNQTNLGAFANIMNAFKMAKGKYVASLHDDDLWEETFLEKLVPPLEANPDVAIAFCDHYLIDENDEIDYPETENCTKYNHRDSLKQGVYQPFCKLAIVDGAVSPAIAAVIRNQVVDWDKIPPEVGVADDMYVNYICCRSGYGAYYYPERLTSHRVHLKSDTYSYDRKNIEANIRKAKNIAFCYQQFMADERLKELKPYFKKKWSHYTTTIGINLLRAKQPSEARSYLFSALSQHPTNFRTLVALFLSFTPKSFANRY